MTAQLSSILLLILFLSCTTGSYLGYPRINFAGFFRADVNLGNNDDCYYHSDYKPKTYALNTDHYRGYAGTNEFEWFETKVTSVFLQNGEESKDDPIIGNYIVSNLERPFAKLVDLDVDCQDKSTIYGMKFGLVTNRTNAEDNLVFIGNWTPSVIAQDMWQHVACFEDSSKLCQDTQFGASSTTMIKNITWNISGTKSKAIKDLNRAAEDANLHVHISLSLYSCLCPSKSSCNKYNATLGHVIGSIGVPSSSDTLNVPGNRIVSPVDSSRPKLEPDMQCYKEATSDESKQTWVYKAPFEVDENLNELRIDFSNTFTVDSSGTINDIGKLNLAIQKDKKSCVQLLAKSEIPYNTEGDLFAKYSGILKVSMHVEDLQHLENGYRLLVVQTYSVGSKESSNICAEKIFSSRQNHAANILGQEPEYYVRPREYYISRLSTGDRFELPFLVTQYGNPVEEKYLKTILTGNPLPLPTDAIKIPEEPQLITNGVANLVYKAFHSPPPNRTYESPPCPHYSNSSKTLPIDGNVYYFGYQVCSTYTNCLPVEFDYTPVIYYFSDVEKVEPNKINWIEHIRPILLPFSQVTKIMKYILDLSNYTMVVHNHNRELMKIALNLDFNHPGYMPTTRDLSPAKRDMILAWLNQKGTPLYDSKGSKPTHNPEYQCPVIDQLDQRCTRIIQSDRHPYYLQESLYDSDPKLHIELNNFILSLKQQSKEVRPLMGMHEIKQQGNCNIDAIRKQLQTAIKLEFTVIPPYLTVLYSIVEGCNLEVYHRIRSVAMQEMEHMAQAANLLIAVGGNPIIDSELFVPKYPTQLPGSVLPGLEVSIRKASILHIKEILMGIEVPVDIQLGDSLSIGTFYMEIEKCINELGKDIFKNPRVERQVLWPWKSSTSKVMNVTSVKEANNAINMIVEQGEGTSILDPSSFKKKSDLAHFFKFEEIVCGHELVYNESNNSYSYTGAKVPFNPGGVWNMRDNPSAHSIARHTNCYTEARAFHVTFRKLLKTLHEMFNGHPDEIKNALLLMESLQVHAKKTMWTKYMPNSLYTCGPVWDYHWDP